MQLEQDAEREARYGEDDTDATEREAVTHKREARYGEARHGKRGSNCIVNMTHYKEVFKEFFVLFKRVAEQERDFLNNQIMLLQAEQMMLHKIKIAHHNKDVTMAAAKRIKTIYSLIASKRKVLDRRTRELLKRKSKGAHYGFDSEPIVT